MLSEVVYGKSIKGEVIDFTMLECGGCGIPFFVPTKWNRAKVENHGSFHCPNGCNRVYTGKTKAEKLAEELEQEKQRRIKEGQELQDKWLDALGEKTKLEKKLKRVSNGVCPCCNRTFQNLHQHMKKQHPDHMTK